MNRKNQLVAINHSHPPYSDKTQERHLGESGRNHNADYARMADRASEDVDLIFTATNHFETEGKSFWEDLREDIERRGGEAYLDDIVFRGEISGTRVYGLHGVEAAHKENLDHEYLIHGLPLDDERDHTYEELDDMLEETENAEIGTLPHPFFLDFDWGKEKREEFFEAASDYDAELSIEYSHGYGFLNHLANGTLLSDQDVGDLCEKYELNGVPGADLHSSVPKETALMDYSAVDSLEDDEFPLKEFKDMRLTNRPGYLPSVWNSLRDTAGSMLSFRDMIPLAGRVMPGAKNTHRKLSLATESFMSELDPEELEENAVRLNGAEGILGNEL